MAGEARLRLASATRIPYHLLDAIADMHAALEPESGHFICHYHELGAAVLDAGGDAIPLLTVDGCLGVTTDPAAVKTLVQAARPGADVARLVSDPRRASYLTLALSALRAANASGSLYTLTLDGGEESVLIVARDRVGEAAFILLPRCGEEGEAAEKNKPGMFV